MAFPYTEEQLNTLDKQVLIQLILSQQEQLDSMDQKLQLILEQLASGNRNRFGRSSEQLETDGQISFAEVNGQICFFNEAEAVADPEFPEPESLEIRHRAPKEKGKKERDLQDLPVIPVQHMLSEEQLTAEFGPSGWKKLPDEIIRRYRFVPARVEVEEHHIGVYAGKTDGHIVKAEHPASLTLMRGGLVSPSIAAAIMNGKYVNAVPLYRMEKEFERYGLSIPRQNMANWMIALADRYLAVLYDYLHTKLYGYHVLQADETPVTVNKDGRPAGSKSYMWVYRTGKVYKDRPVVLYDYQQTRNASHPREFLKDFSGVCVTDGYQVYHTIEKEREDLVIAGCWAHARRRYDEALKALPKEKRKACLADTALRMIQAIYREDNRLADFPNGERQSQRQLVVRPLVEAYFAWCRTNIASVLKGSKTYNGLSYSINQEKYLKTFLTDPEVSLDNNAAEQTIRSFCIGKKNWEMIDTIGGARSSAIIYSIAETAKLNGLKPYDYFAYLLTVIPEHMDDTSRNFCEDILPWSPNLPENIRKK